jgi:hypothetical protein
VVRTDDVEKGRAGEASFVILYGIDGVGDATAVQFLEVDFSPGFACEGQSEHLDAKNVRRDFAFGLKRRLGGGNKNNAIERRFFASGLSNQEMPEVNGIEGPAVKTDTHRYLKYSWMVLTS